jgi:hypothetical protein
MTAPLLALLAFGLAADAPEARSNAISLEVPSLLWNGAELVGERFLAPHFSVQVALGIRTAAEGDFRSLTAGGGLGARFWLNRLQLFSDLGGPLLGVRVDGAWTGITPYPGGRTLSTGSAAASLRLGYRFVLARRVEVTPEAGVAVSFGFDAAPWLVVVPRPGAVFGLTVGYLF